jgi:uncharacterized Zn-finger protein
MIAPGKVVVMCDGSSKSQEIDADMGHPAVYLTVDSNLGYVECPYCSRKLKPESHNKQ